MVNQHCSNAICPDISQCKKPWKVTYNNEIIDPNAMETDPHIEVICKGLKFDPICVK